MITVTVTEETTVDGQTVKKSVTVNYLPENSQSNVDEINKLREELEKAKQSVESADKRNKPANYT